MHHRGFSLIEIIFVVLISALLSIGSFKAFEALFIRSAKAKAITDLSLASQSVLDQLSLLLYNRIPNSVIGYNGSTCASIETLSGNYHTIEWLGEAYEEKLLGLYDGFIDLNASNKATLTLSAPNINAPYDTTNKNLIFAGAFDDGSEEIEVCLGAFGWHGADSNLSFGFSVPATNQIRFAVGDIPQSIYEKYYITDGAYAVTRGENVADISGCSGVSESDFKNFDDTLFLFYEYYPYLGQTFCGDGGSGKVAVLAEHVSGFRATAINDTIRLSIDMNQSIRGSDASVHVSKQKAVF
jgi:prepilin-type N-terminal cleavage/methylation domain-containing protein